jgi:hypothetical protein
MSDNIQDMRLVLENLPASLQGQRETLARCIEAMDRALPLRRAILFGSHARGDARSDSDVDLCLVSDGAERQSEATSKFTEAVWDIWPCPTFTLLPISTARLAEKQAVGDHFFTTVLKEGVILATED